MWLIELLQSLISFMLFLIKILIILIVILVACIISLIFSVSGREEKLKELILERNDEVKSSNGQVKVAVHVLNKKYYIDIPNREAKIKEMIKKNEKVKVAFFHPFW